MSSTRSQAIQQHCEKAFKSKATRLTFDKGPAHDLPEDFCVLEIAPIENRPVWFYVSCGMSFADANPIEIYLISPRQAVEHLELFYAIAHYHMTGEALDTGHTVNFGRPWMPRSTCEYGLLSVLNGEIDWAEIEGKNVHFLWLIPITLEERDFKIEFGLDALDERFADADVDCANPSRESAV